MKKILFTLSFLFTMSAIAEDLNMVECYELRNVIHSLDMGGNVHSSTAPNYKKSATNLTDEEKQYLKKLDEYESSYEEEMARIKSNYYGALTQRANQLQKIYDENKCGQNFDTLNSILQQTGLDKPVPRPDYPIYRPPLPPQFLMKESKKKNWPKRYAVPFGTFFNDFKNKES